ncbi:hypothetical protein Tco_0593883 [Tanacetum coccineum]
MQKQLTGHQSLLIGQQVAPEILAAHTAWVKGSKEIARLMLMTMDSEISTKSGKLLAYDNASGVEDSVFAQQDEQELLIRTYARFPLLKAGRRACQLARPGGKTGPQGTTYHSRSVYYIDAEDMELGDLGDLANKYQSRFNRNQMIFNLTTVKNILMYLRILKDMFQVYGSSLDWIMVFVFNGTVRMIGKELPSPKVFSLLHCNAEYIAAL